MSGSYVQLGHRTLALKGHNTRMIKMVDLTIRHGLSIVLAFAFIVFSYVGNNEAQAQSGGSIQNIQVEGNRRVEPETVRTYMQLGPGDRYEAYKVDASLKALFSTGLFSDVKIRKSGGTVIVTVVENPIINQVAFEGNSEVDDPTLGSEVQLKARSVFTRAKVQADVQRILDVYSRNGRFAASVDPKIIELDHNRVDLVYEIYEGPSTKVKSINFIGNSAFSDKQLRSVITTSQTNLLSFLKPTDIYDPDRLNLDRELLRQHYLKNGYADARVISAVADLDPAGTGFYITFTVEEGDPYRFGDILIETSLSDLDPDSLRSQLKTRSGRTYNAAEVDKTIEALTVAVSEKGYAFARVRPRADRDPIERTIGVNYVIEQGPRVYIERINIIGNTRTLDYVIRREFRIEEGDAYNRLLVDRARQRLVALRFFKKVTISRQRGSAADRIILNVHVIEESTGELSFGVGYSTQEGVIGDISISERNLMGRGQFIRLKLGGSFERAQIDLSFTEPRFLGRNLSAGFDIFHKEVDYTDESSYSSTRTGGGLRLGFPISENIWLTTRYTFTREDIDAEDDASDAILQAEGVNNISAIGYTISYDTRNVKRNPSKGIYLSLSQELAGVGGDINYLRTVAEARAYYPIRDKIVLVGRLVGGHITGWDGQDVRLVDSFYKGGETIRGFARSGYGPRDDDGDSLGGTMFYAGTIEARFPIPFVPEELGLGGAIFADAGTLYDVGTGPSAGETFFDSDSIRASVGASILWESPLGPLRADFAYVISSESFDEEEAFRFGASTQF